MFRGLRQGPPSLADERRSPKCSALLYFPKRIAIVRVRRAAIASDNPRLWTRPARTALVFANTRSSVTAERMYANAPPSPSEFHILLIAIPDDVARKCRLSEPKGD